MIKNSVTWHTMDKDQISESFGSHLSQGLTDEQVENLRDTYGWNRLEEAKRKTMFSRFIDQFKDFMIIILIIAAAVSFVLGEHTDAIIIISIVVLNALFGVIQENKAEKSLDALKKLSAPNAKVLRNGQTVVIPSCELVPGDIILLEAGDLLSADGRLIEVANFKVEEASLTGESLPVEKTIKTLPADLPLGDRKNMVFSSSIVVYGRGRAIVTETGMNTEVGKIATMILTTEAESTPLQKSIGQLGKNLGIITLGICAFIFAVGLFQGKGLFEMFLTSVSLAVAAIPEGLPAIVTVVLALGVQRMVKKHAIIRKMPAVETLGSASIICSDKTGTLTENKMTIVELATMNGSSEDISDPNFNDLLTWGALCTDAEIRVQTDGSLKEIGDPTELAIVMAAHKQNLIKSQIETQLPRVFELPFDSTRKLMTTFHKTASDFLAITKGAPDVLLAACDTILGPNGTEPLTPELRARIEAFNQSMGEKALRVLALATRTHATLPESNEPTDIETGLMFIGLLGMIDPPRKEVKDAVAVCNSAGIRAIMITGDHPVTASTIARNLGILNDGDLTITGQELAQMSQEDLEENLTKYSVYARVAPEHKVRIVDAWQKAGHIVAMTGDGVNDAPALKKANIGCAMGITGTDVSKEAADMILTDDNFATIVSAVQEGRNIYDNIRKSIHFLLSCNSGEILVFFIAISLAWDSPLLPIHILWVNLVTDSLPALALGMEPADPNIMERGPRDPNKGIFAGGLGREIIVQGSLVAAVTLAAFWISGDHISGGGIETGRTMAFATLGIVQLVLAWGLRSELPLLKIGLASNPWMIGAFFTSLALQLAVLLIPPLQEIFSLVPLSCEQWLWVLALSFIPAVLVEIRKWVILALKK